MIGDTIADVDNPVALPQIHVACNCLGVRLALETKRYGGFLKASMPQFWQTTDSTVVQGALQRLVTDR